MKKFLLLLSFGLILLPFAASAQWGSAGSKLQTVGNQTGLQANLETSVGTIIASALALVGTIFLILTVYAGILWMTASGSEEKVTKAKNIITAAIIGLVITMAAYAITSFVTNRLSGGGSVSVTDAASCAAAGGVCSVNSGCTDVSPDLKQIGTCADKACCKAQ